MALILCIETGTDVCSVGVAKDGEIIALRESSEGRDHATKVALFVDELLKEMNLTPKELEAVAVGMGPGSYTGLRIGVSFAKGLCYALNIPLIAVGSLNVLCEIARNQPEVSKIENSSKVLLCPMIDARRMEVYTQTFDIDGVAQSEVEAKIIDEESFADQREAGAFILFGNGAEKSHSVLPWTTLIEVKPSVVGMSRLAQEKFDREEVEDIAYFEPFYLKDFVVTTSQKKLF